MKHRRIKQKLVLYLLLCVPFVAQACKWCDNQPIPLLEKLAEKEKRGRAQYSSLLPQDIEKENQAGVASALCRWQEEDAHFFKQSWQPSSFYTRYLSVFYPRADFIVEVLAPTMCVFAFNKALQDIIHFIYKDSYRYFSNQSFSLSRLHVKILIEQLSRIEKAIHKEIWVDPMSDMLLLNPLSSFDETFIEVCEEEGEESLHDFICFYSDYLIRGCYIDVLCNKYVAVLEGVEKVAHVRTTYLQKTPHYHRYTQLQLQYESVLEMMRAEGRWI